MDLLVGIVVLTILTVLGGVLIYHFGKDIRW